MNMTAVQYYWYISPRCITTHRICDKSHPIEIEGEVALLVRTGCRGGMKDVYDPLA